MFFDHMEEIERLIKLVSESDISEFKIEEEEIKITIHKCHKKHSIPCEKNNVGQGFGMIPLAPPASSVPPMQPVPEGYVSKYGVVQNGAFFNPAANLNHSVMGEMKENEASSDGNKVKSPLVGTFYAASSPDKDPFVKKGDLVKKGQVLGIVEAMKLMNEIECEYDGVVVDILVQNGELVEYGQPLFIIK